MILSSESASSIIKRQGEIVTEMKAIYEGEIKDLRVRLTLVEEENRRLKEKLERGVDDRER